MSKLTTTALSAALLALFAAATPAAHATIVSVIVTGEVEFNGINFPPLSGATPGSPATITFNVDSDVFTNGTAATRGYPIDPASFSMTLGAVTVGLQSPLPAGVTPYLSIRNNDPGVDGFMLTDNISSPNGVPLSVPGMVGGQFKDNFYVTYTGTTLPSLDILDAVGTYTFAGLTVFNWTITDGPFDAMGLIFAELTLSTGPGPELFQRGDCNNDAGSNIADAIYLLSSLFPMPGAPGPTLECESACDGNDDGQINIADAIALLNALFGAPPTPLPGPTGACGDDTATPDGLACTTQSGC